MNLILYCPIWGMTDQNLESVLIKIKSAAYDGAEIAIDPEKQDIFAIKRLFDKHKLRMIVQHPFSEGTSPAEYKKDFIAKLEALTILRPDKINCHTGKDYFSVIDNSNIIEAAITISVKTGVEIVHEIHRGRFSFSTLLINQYISRFPELKLTADFSHWCVVSSSLLEDQEKIIAKVVPHTRLVHARVGHNQAPQVTHPGAPENKYALERHLSWWKKIFDWHLDQKIPEFCVTCEFGPVPYLPTLPFTNMPVASQWEMNLFMKKLMIRKFKEWTPKTRKK